MTHAFEVLANALDIPYRTKNQRIWLLRTESGSFYQDFNINNYVALGWDKISKALIEKMIQLNCVRLSSSHTLQKANLD